jgi:predicted ester cyclase
MSTEEQKDRVRHVVDETYSKGNLDVMDEFWAADLVYHHPPLPDFKGLEATKQFVIGFRKAFSDIQFTIDDLIVEGDMGAMRWSIQATHAGPSPALAIPATGKRVTLKGLAMWRMVNGKGVEMWNYPDMLGLMQQLGVGPATGKAGG